MYTCLCVHTHIFMRYSQPNYLLHRVVLKMIFWDMTPCSQVDGYHYLGATCSHDLQGGKQKLHILLKCLCVFTTPCDAASQKTVIFIFSDTRTFVTLVSALQYLQNSLQVLAWSVVCTWQ